MDKDKLDGIVIVPGIYKHFKGTLYEVVGTAVNTETNECLVVYVAVKGPKVLWARPLLMFQEMVEVGGTMVPRFELVEEFRDGNE